MTPKDFVNQFFRENLPHCNALGIRVVTLDETSVVFALPYNPMLIGTPQNGVIHGGAVTTLLDSACGAAVMMHPQRVGLTATIGLRVDYLRPAHKGDEIWARSEVYRVTQNVAFARAHAWSYSLGEDKVSAVATGTFTFQKA